MDRGVKLLGMDTPQADSPKNGRGAERIWPVHKILLAAGMIKLEYMTNLRELGTSEFELIALPLKIWKPTAPWCAASASSTPERRGPHDDSRELVRDFFAQNGTFRCRRARRLDLHYLDAQLIDSFGIVTMISDFESALGITFTAEDMQSYEFQTVGGLIGIIDRLASTSAS